MNLVLIDSEKLSPTSNGHGYAIVRKKAIAGRVSLLFSSSCPAAILLAVSLGVVFAVNAVLAGRSRPHVLVESLERLTPSLAYGNAATSVILIADVCEVVATGNHEAPDPVLPRVGQPVLKLSSNGGLFGKASAALLALIQVGSGNDSRPATIAKATPKQFALLPSTNKGLDQKPAETLTYDVAAGSSKPNGFFDRIDFSHGPDLQNRFVSWLEPTWR